MLAKLKAGLAIAATYIAFAALVVFWFFSRRPKTNKAKINAALEEERARNVKVEKVPDSIEEVR